MKTAIICDWLVTIGGAEKVLGELIECFPAADLYAVVDHIDPYYRDFLKGKSVNTTFIQKLPYSKTKYRSYLPLMPFAIEQLDLSNYDLIISSSHAVAKGVITGPNQLHISYVHTPMRYAWDLQHQYLQESGLDKKFIGYFARYLLHRMRLWDLRTTNSVDHFIANSQFIAKRINKNYRRDAEVIYPPVDTSHFAPHTEKEDFYLTASRLVPYKKIAAIVDSFKLLPDKKLIVIGEGPELAKIKAKAGANVEVLGYQPTDVLIKYMQRAKAFIFAAEEDFGITPLEAQACGTPVIAFGKGGALETVCGLEHANPSGVFFHEQTPQSICAGVYKFEVNQHLITAENCIANAARFSVEKFRNNIKQFVEEKSKVFFK